VRILIADRHESHRTKGDFFAKKSIISDAGTKERLRNQDHSTPLMTGGQSMPDAECQDTVTRSLVRLLAGSSVRLASPQLMV
jgi:hypothetical protein